jgi:hypothetical protein
MKLLDLLSRLRGISHKRFETRLSTDECRRRLTEVIHIERVAVSWSGYAGARPILGYFDGDSFRLQDRIYYRNPSRRFFYGRFVVAGNGTRIEGEFRSRRWDEVGALVAVCFISLWLVVALCVGNVPLTQRLLMAGAAICLIAFIVILRWFGQWLGRGGEQDIVDVMKRVLEAHEIGEN